MHRLTRYHIGIIITGCLLCFGPATMVMNSWSIFMVPVSEYLHVSTSVFSLQPSVIYLACALFAPIGGWLIERFNLKIVLTCASIAGAGSVALCSLCTHMWQLFALGAIEGCAGVVLLFLMLPNLISRWFTEKMGTVIGVCIAMAGIGGATWAYLGGLVMVHSSWREAYLVLGVTALIISLLPCLFLLHNRPSDVGVEPYGAQSNSDAETKDVNGKTVETETNDSIGKTVETIPAKEPLSKGVPAAVAFRSSTFYLYSVAIGLLTGVIGLANLLPTYVYYLGEHGFFTMTIAQLIIAASTVALCTQIAQACFKVSLGILADHNVLSAFIIALACGISAILCFLFGYSFPAVIFTGGALYGSLFAVGDVLSPVLMRKFFGDLDYTKIYARFTLFVNIVPAFAIIVFAHLSNRSWVATFVVGIIALLTTLVLALIAMKKSKQLQDSFVTG